MHKLNILYGSTQCSHHCMAQKQSFRSTNSNIVCLLSGNIISYYSVNTKALICGTSFFKELHQAMYDQCNTGMKRLINYNMTMSISMIFSSISFAETFKTTRNHSALVMLLHNIRQANITSMCTRSDSSQYASLQIPFIVTSTLVNNSTDAILFFHNATWTNTQSVLVNSKLTFVA